MRQPRTLHVEADGIHYWAPNPAWRPSPVRWLLWRLRARRQRGRTVTVPAGYRDVGYYAPHPVDPVCTCPEDEAGRAATYTCRMGTEPHRVNCPRWGMPVEAMRRLL